MVELKDLTGISKQKRIKAISCLDSLLAFRNQDGTLSPIISGYNWYASVPKHDSTVTFSNIHETEAYKKDLLGDLEKLGYNRKTLIEYIRKKCGIFLCDLDFITRDKNDLVLPGLKIKDMRTNMYLNLEKFSKPLSNYPEFKEAEGYLLSEDDGWEIGIPFTNKKEILGIADLFLKKSGLNLYDHNRNVITETKEEMLIRAPWTDAYQVPILLLGETASIYKKELPQFIQATKFSLKENANEINFVICKNLARLKGTAEYIGLLDIGFKEETCFGNYIFIKYIDEIRKV